MTPSIPSETFERWVREHHEGVYRTALMLSRSEADALDVTQQVFLRVLDGRLRLAEADDAGRLLRWQAVRETRMARRSARRRRRREDRHAMQRPDRIEEVASAGLEDEETRGVLSSLLGDLPEDLLAALTLRFQASWTYAEIGASLGISEPSAHARVRRGLERLRQGLTRVGLAGQAALIPELLAGTPPAPLPPGIEHQLLSLPSTAAVAARSTAAVWIAATLTAGLAVGVAALGGAFSSGPSGELAAGDLTDLAQPESPGARTPPPPPTTRDDHRAGPAVADEGRNPVPPPPEASPAAPVARGTLSTAIGILPGRVVDAAAGAPVEGAVVLAESVQRDGKMARYSATTESDARGLFRLELVVQGDDGQDYLLTARTPSSSTRTPVLRVLPGAEAPFQVLELTPGAGDRPGEFELTVRMEGPDGAPVEGARARLLDRRTYPGGEHGFVDPREGISDAAGRLRLAGDRLGPKALRVDARGAGFGLRFEEFTLETPGARERVVRLTPALTISGRLSRVDGAPLEDAEQDSWHRLGLVAFSPAEPNDWITARVGPQGEFRLEGLDARDYTVRASGPGLSSGTLFAVPAGSAGLEIELKASDDPTDHGLHDGEFHGRLVDALDGSPVLAGPYAVSFESLSDGQDHDLVARVLSPRPYQTAAIGREPPPSETFHLTGLPPGKYLVVARARGFAPAWAGPFELSAGQLIDGLVLPLECGVEVAGRVLDGRGRALAGALVVLVGEGEPSRAALLERDREVRDKDGQGAMFFASARSDREGRFRFPGPIPTREPVRPVALHPDFEPGPGPRLSPDTVGEIELTLGRPRER